jgi:hypothetical protein
MGNSSECWTREVRERDELERTIDWKQGLAISIGVVYLNSLEIGWCSTWVGLLVMALYVPLWIYSQHETGVDLHRS